MLWEAENISLNKFCMTDDIRMALEKKRKFIPNKWTNVPEANPGADLLQPKVCDYCSDTFERQRYKKGANNYEIFS